MIKFEKISQKQWERDLNALLIRSYSYDNGKIPTRATRNASGHDFVTPFIQSRTGRKHYNPDRHPHGDRSASLAGHAA